MNLMMWSLFFVSVSFFIMRCCNLVLIVVWGLFDVFMSEMCIW